MNCDLGRRDNGPPRKDCIYEGSSVHKMDQQWVSKGMLGINVWTILLGYHS